MKAICAGCGGKVAVTKVSQNVHEVETAPCKKCGGIQAIVTMTKNDNIKMIKEK